MPIIWRYTLFALVCGLLACTQRNHEPITIATNPWPGYELLHLAEEEGFFTQVGLDIRLVELSSLADAQRAYITGKVDGFTSTLVEAVQASLYGSQPLQIALLADYSDGGDVIIARKNIPSLEALKGRKVGCEVTALGIFVLHKALNTVGLSLSDVEVVNVEQLKGLAAMEAGEIDAYVTYPPTSLQLLDRSDSYQQVFSSREIPQEILDTVSLRTSLLEQRPDLVKKLISAWQLAFTYVQQSPQAAFTFMANREGISAEDFRTVYEEEIVVFSGPQIQQQLGKYTKLEGAVVDVCEILKDLGQHQQECSAMASMVYRGER